MPLFETYIVNNLMPNEKMLYKTQVHWFVYIPAILPFAAALVASFYYPVVAGALVFLSGCILLKAYIQTHTSEFAVTSSRIIAKIGWIRRSVIEMRHDKVESVSLDQGIAGRIFGFGTVMLHGTGSGITPLTDIDNPLEFRKFALEAIEKKAGS